MSLWSRIRELFVGRDRGFMVRDGHELHWPRAALPITVLTAPSADNWQPILNTVVKRINHAIGRRVFLFPVPAIPGMLSAYRDPATERMQIPAVLVETRPELGDLHGHTLHRYDRRTGAIRNSMMVLPPLRAFGQSLTPETAEAVAMHELGHDLGLDHDEDLSSIMHHKVRVRGGQELLPTDIARLRRRYG